MTTTVAAVPARRAIGVDDGRPLRSRRAARKLPLLLALSLLLTQIPSDTSAEVAQRVQGDSGENGFRLQFAVKGP